MTYDPRSFSTLPNSPNAENNNSPTVVEPTFYVPKADRKGHRTAFDMCQLVGETRLTRNSRTCPTRELAFLPAQWGRHKSPYRKFRHMANVFYSAPFQRLLFPDLFCVGSVATFVTYYNEWIVACQQGSLATTTLSMSPSAFAGATTAIGLLAGFRLNTSVGRMKEGRATWNVVTTATRDLARQTLMWLQGEDQKRMLRLCQAFPVTLLFHLNGKGCHHNMKRKSKPGEAAFSERVQAEFEAELGDVYHPSKPDHTPQFQQDFDRLCSVKNNGGNTPSEVILCMTELIAAASHPPPTQEPLHPVFVRELDVHVQRLGHALGSSEGILKTPLPTGFTRHSSRLLFIWSNGLPFALYPLLGPLGTLPASLLTAYAVLGIEDVSVQLEEPFDILPLREYSDSIYMGVDDMAANFHQSKK